MGNKIVLFLVAIIALVGVSTALLFTREHVMAGSVIDPPVPAPDINLPSSHGDQFHLQDQQGKLVLLFFGYTFCPDVCPATLVNMQQIKKQLGERASLVTFVFVTVDPGRDTQDQMARYMKSFDETFYGLTGSEKELEQIWDAFGVYRETQESNSSFAYLVDHTSRLYLINKNGQLSATYLVDTPVGSIVSDLKYMLTQRDP